MFLLPCGNYFNPDVGLEYSAQDFSSHIIPNIWDLANCELAKYGLGPIDHEKDFGPVHEISSEVGDDEISISQSLPFLGILSPLHRIFGMKVSEEDTSINPNVGNFCEEIIFKPGSYYQTYASVKQVSENQDSLAYLDVCKLRLAINVRPGRMNHSATNDGKISMVGSRGFWIPFTSPIKGIYEVFSLYQDINLDLKRDKKFLYLPSQMGGYGKPLPFNEPSNFRRFNKCFRQGTYEDLNNEIVRRANKAFYKLERNPTDYEEDLLLSHVVRFQSQYHDWIKNRSIYCPVTWIDVPPEIGRWKIATNSYETRVAAQVLHSEGLVVSETSLAVRVEHNELCKALLGSENMASFKKKREEKFLDWKQLSIYGLKSIGAIKEVSLDNFRQGPLKDYEIFTFFKNIKENAGRLKVLLRNESYYWPEAIDEVYRKGPMMVRISMHPQTGDGYKGFVEHKFDFMDSSIKERPKLYEWLRNPEGFAPRTFIPDDGVILENVKHSHISVIITDDIRLCEKASMVSPTIRIPIVWYYLNLYFGEGDPDIWEKTIRKKYPAWEVTVFEDTGSIASGEEKYFNDGVMLERPISHKFRVTSFKQGNPSMYPSETMEFNPSMETEVYDPRGLLRRRGLH